MKAKWLVCLLAAACLWAGCGEEDVALENQTATQALVIKDCVGNTYFADEEERFFRVEELDPETAEELEMGDIAVIYGDDYVDNRDPHPGVYLNAVKVDKAADGTQEDVEACQKYLDKLYEYPDQEPLPKMLLEYQDTSQVLDSVEYSWKFQDKLGSHGITSAEISLLEYPEITRIDLESPADLKLSFPGKPETLTAVRWSSDFWEAGDTAGAGEGETVALTPEEKSLIIQGAEPGYVYQILMENSQGYVKFGFLTE